MSLQLIRISGDNSKIQRCCSLSLLTCNLLNLLIKILRIILVRHIALLTTMPILTLIIPFYVGIYIVGVSGEVNLAESIILAQCRGSCLHVFTHPSSSSREESCRKNADCYMCWNSCRLIQGNSPSHLSLCSDNTSCFPGCKAACRFYHLSRRNNTQPPDDLPPVWSAYMDSPVLNSEGQLEWKVPVWTDNSKTPPPDEAIVYIVMVIIGGKWTQHIQTSSMRAIIPDSIRQSKVRVLAVTSLGLAAYSEASMSELTTPAAIPLLPSSGESTRKTPLGISTSTSRTISQDVSIPSQAVPSNEEIVISAPVRKESHWATQGNLYSRHREQESDSQPPSVTIDRSWEVELEPKSVSVLARVAVRWEVRGSGQVDYMVTWMEASGGISGHLVSQQTSAEISLWSSQEYFVQVELLDQHGNSVLRSQPKPISFRSSSRTTSVIRRILPFSRPVARTTSIPTTTPRHTTTYHYAISRRGNDQINLPSEQDLQMTHGEIVPDRKQYLGQHYAYSDTFSTYPPWPPRRSENEPNWGGVESSQHGEIHQTLMNSSSGDGNSEESDSEEKQFNSLLVWAVCLGVGAVLIVLLIILAIRTIGRGRGRGRKRQSLSRGEDYLSETTTTTSSVNSSNTVTPQGNDLNQLHQHLPRREEQQQWTYEPYYGTAEQPMGVFAAPRIQQAIQPTCPLNTFPNPHITVHNHPQHTTTRIDSASLIENYILSLDPSPIVKQINY